MPTLTHDQALAKYLAIMDHEGIKPNHILDKSALFQRLLQGGRALAMPPPLAHSYPWYEVVESDTPLFIEQPQSWPLSDHGETVLIFQTTWIVLARDNDRLRLTSPHWQALGYEWEAWQEWRTADEAGSRLLCHHDPKKGLLLTADDIDQEIAFRVQRWTNTLTIAAMDNDEKALGLLQTMMSDGDSSPRHRQFDKAWAQQTLDNAREELAQRAQQHKPAQPDANDIKEKRIQELRSLLGKDWEIRDGLLCRRCWLIQRVTPAVLPESAYLAEIGEPATV